MKWISALIFSLLISGFILSCGGSKETLDYTPPKLPKPLTEEDTTRVEPVTEALEPKEKVDIVPKKKVIELQRIHFEFDSAELTPEARSILAKNAEILLENSDIRIRIEGHCDERGTVEYNLALGERRALAAAQYLMNYGIDANRIEIISFGKERPLDPRHTPEAWTKNRRAEFVIINQ